MLGRLGWSLRRGRGGRRGALSILHTIFFLVGQLVVDGFE